MPPFLICKTGLNLLWGSSWELNVCNIYMLSIIYIYKALIAYVAHSEPWNTWFELTMSPQEWRGEEDGCRNSGWVIQEEFTIIYLSSLPLITFLWHLRWNTKFSISSTAANSAFTDSPRGQSASLQCGEDSCPGDMPWVRLFRALISPLGRYWDNWTQWFSELSGWEKIVGLCLPALICVQKSPPAEFKQVFPWPQLPLFWEA